MRGRREPDACHCIFLQPGRGKRDLAGEGGGEAAGAGCPQPGCSSDNKQVWLGEFPISAARRCCPRRFHPPALLPVAGGNEGRCTPKPSLGNCSRCFLSWGSGVVWFLDQLMQGGRMDGWICGLPTCIGGVSNREAVFLRALV